MQVLCFWRFNKPRHSIIIPCFIKIRHSAIHIPNKAPINFPSMIDTITNSKKTVMFSQHPEDTPQKPHNSRDCTAKSIIKQPSQDHPSTATHTKGYFLPFQDHKQPISPFQDHKLHTIPNSQDHLNTSDVREIIALKCIPQLFWHNRKHARTIYNKSGLLNTLSSTCLQKGSNWSQRRDRKSPTKDSWQWNYCPCHLTHQMGLITNIPKESDGTINPCLDPYNLNKAIIHEHYKALSLEDISHKFSGTTAFSKLDVKDGFWSIHLDTPSSYLTTCNTHKGCYSCLCVSFGLKMSQDVFQMWMNQVTDRLNAIHDDICVFWKTREEHDTHMLQLMKTAAKMV